MFRLSEEQIKVLYNEALNNYKAALGSMEYSIKDRTLKRQRLKDLSAEISKLERMLDSVKNNRTGSIRVRRAAPID